MSNDLTLAFTNLQKNITLKAPSPIYLPDHHYENLKNLFTYQLAYLLKTRMNLKKDNEKTSVKNS